MMEDKKETISVTDSESPIIREFLRHLRSVRDLSDKTIKEYGLDLKVFFRFYKQKHRMIELGTAFDEIPIYDVNRDMAVEVSKQDVVDYLDFLANDRLGLTRRTDKEKKVGLSPVSIKRKFACLKTFFYYIYMVKDYSSNKMPTIGVQIAKDKFEKHMPKYLSEEQSIRLLHAVKGLNEKRDYAIILICLVTGLRVGEVVSLNVTDITQRAGGTFVTVRGKGDKDRQIYLSQNVLDAVQDYLAVRDGTHANEKDKNALFLSRKHGRISVDAVQALVKKAMKEAGLESLSPHKLRHTAATMMQQNGTDARTLAAVLGHSSMNMVQIYSHVESWQVREAAACNPMSRVGEEEK